MTDIRTSHPAVIEDAMLAALSGGLILGPVPFDPIEIFATRDPGSHNDSHLIGPCPNPDANG